MIIRNYIHSESLVLTGIKQYTTKQSTKGEPKMSYQQDRYCTPGRWDPNWVGWGLWDICPKERTFNLHTSASWVLVLQTFVTRSESHRKYQRGIWTVGNKCLRATCSMSHVNKAYLFVLLQQNTTDWLAHTEHKFNSHSQSDG